MPFTDMPEAAKRPPFCTFSVSSLARGTVGLSCCHPGPASPDPGWPVPTPQRCTGWGKQAARTRQVARTLQARPFSALTLTPPLRAHRAHVLGARQAGGSLWGDEGHSLQPSSWWLWVDSRLRAGRGPPCLPFPCGPARVDHMAVDDWQ